jgi:hypothetical protein
LDRPNVKDLVSRGWMDAANDCDSCGAPVEVKVLSADDDGTSGSILVRCRHARGCDRLEELEAAQRNENTLVDYDDVAGWVWSDIFAKVGAKRYPTFQAVANVAPCCGCLRLVTDVPFIVWGESQAKPTWQANFCRRCFQEGGLGEMFVRNRAGRQSAET